MLIAFVLLLLGFQWGVMYDQSMFDRTLRRELREERTRNAVLDRALDTLRKNKFKKFDHIYDAMKWIEANQGRIAWTK